MAKQSTQAPAAGHGFGTAPVFLASISTILGAVLFLRFSYAVGHAGVWGTLLIVVVGHLVTIPTALAIAEIATNRKVEGGGEYFIISRTFGTTIGSSIGIALYFSQAVSVAFYMIAFAESFKPLAGWFEAQTGLAFDPRYISLPATVLLVTIVLVKGAALGVGALRIVSAILGVALVSFFLGSPLQEEAAPAIATGPVEGHDSLMLVFAIVFPAFTGMTAGVGLSGDLANPRRSIPLGTLAGTLVGMLVYIALVFKLASSASAETLAGDVTSPELVMMQIALWKPIVPIGLAAATISSAIGSILVAPRTLQALAADQLVPSERLNGFLAAGRGETNEPTNATLVTATLAIITVALGNVDFVARIISMFFMVTYGALCAISVLEHFAARPSYRPSFRSKWYLSVLGAVMCLMLMFQMDPLYALISGTVMVLIYLGVRRVHGGHDDLAAIFTGVMTQASRRSQVLLQRRTTSLQGSEEWRPSIIMVNGNSFERTAPLQFFGWLCHRYGFGLYLHFVPGLLNRDTADDCRSTLERLVEKTVKLNSAVIVDTIVSPSMRSALAQSLQLPGVTGMENNTILFELSEHDDEKMLAEIEDGCNLALAVRMNTLVLRHGDHFFGSRSQIHIWLARHDYRNANLLLLLSYIILGHPDWRQAEIHIFAAFPKAQKDQQEARLSELITSGRLPMSPKNLEIVPTDDRGDYKRTVIERSRDADLVIAGFTARQLADRGTDVFQDFPELNAVLFVSAQQRLLIE